MNIILTFIQEQQVAAVIPRGDYPKAQRKFDWWLYKERHLLECLINKLKLDTRYDNLSCTFSVFLS
ncbi:hypothetical protein [Paenibacillus sp. RS8]|uniref:hypothetical protein n=1 Tax=Paenibacillus sp. RS8 TaxID=3242681 RepID=UPI0035C1E204